MTAIIAFTAQGAKLGRMLVGELEATLHVPQRLAQTTEEEAYDTLPAWVETHWVQGNHLVFIGATGIAIRAIAPFVNDKFTDPSVIALDEQGQFVISLLSGHVGGGNGMAQAIATVTQGQAVISTATDVNGLLAIDVWAKEQNLVIGNRALAKAVSAQLLEGKTVGFGSDCGYDCPQGLTPDTNLKLGVWVSTKPGDSPFETTLPLIPKTLILGIGCRRGTSERDISEAVTQALGAYSVDAVCQVASIDLKAEEPGLLAFCQRLCVKFITFTSAQLQGVRGEFTPSAFVASVTGVDNVCERSAVLAGGQLVVKKQAKNGVTVAVSQMN